MGLTLTHTSSLSTATDHVHSFMADVFPNDTGLFQPADATLLRNRLRNMTKCSGCWLGPSKYQRFQFDWALMGFLCLRLHITSCRTTGVLCSPSFDASQVFWCNKSGTYTILVVSFWYCGWTQCAICSMNCKNVLFSTVRALYVTTDKLLCHLF